ncbi:MliC family protein [Denitratimonas tolerans]|uniref:MliC family protein n=1 Tax=Denitratimonas tolerans TaxID=1338420 RepID=A0AAW9R4H8_9GAMM|nr:MliC family protein [Chiayiivirga sp.]HRQ36141.1 MliC family protein [Chiayiivirga sp.]
MRPTLSVPALSGTLALTACAGTLDVATSNATTTYQCESGILIKAGYPDTDHARVEYQGSTYELTIAISASGARYVGGGVEWWTKGSGPGSTASLFVHLDDGSSGAVIENCAAR